MIRPFLATGLTLFLLAFLLPTINYDNWITLLIASVVLTIINSLLKPILKLLTLPLNLVTFGVFGVVLNVGLLWLLTYLVPGFSIQSMVIAGVPITFFFSLLLTSVLISFIHRLIRFIL
ncbi:MAG TPA: phage holin family protein [Patescibacteria group bacterium]